MANIELVEGDVGATVTTTIYDDSGAVIPFEDGDRITLDVDVFGTTVEVVGTPGVADGDVDWIVTADLTELPGEYAARWYIERGVVLNAYPTTGQPYTVLIRANTRAH